MKGRVHMFTTTGIFFFAMLFCLIGGFLVFELINKKGRPSFNAPFFALSCLLATVIIIINLFYWVPSDFISGISQASFIAPAVVLVGLCLLSLGFSSLVLQFLALVAAIGAIVFGFGLFVSFSEALPPILNQFFTAFLWVAICYVPRVINLNIGLVSIQTLTISLGCFILYSIGVLPLAIGVLALSISTLFACWLLVSRQYPHVLISDKMCNLLGFVLGWLVVYAAIEGVGSCVLIFGLYPLLEVLFALAQKLTFLPQFAIVKNNTFYIRLADKSMPPAVINRYLLRTDAMCIFFGCFQVFAPNSYSIPVFCLLAVLWQLYRLYTWQGASESIKEINQKFVANVKNNLSEISENLRRKGEE